MHARTRRRWRQGAAHRGLWILLLLCAVPAAAGAAGDPAVCQLQGKKFSPGAVVAGPQGALVCHSVGGRQWWQAPGPLCPGQGMCLYESRATHHGGSLEMDGGALRVCLSPRENPRWMAPAEWATHCPGS